MKNNPTSLLASLLLSVVVFSASACFKADHSAHNTSASTAANAVNQPNRYPLKGVITDILPEQSALLVKHEEIPGYMMAMTMLFKVDAATLKAAVKGHAISGTLVEAGEEFRLEDMKPVAP